MMRGLLPIYPSGTMNAATPDGAPPWRIGDQKIKKTLPAVPQRGLEAEVLRICYMILMCTESIHVSFYRAIISPSAEREHFFVP
jgi:hypothetical protein